MVTWKWDRKKQNKKYHNCYNQHKWWDNAQIYSTFWYTNFNVYNTKCYVVRKLLAPEQFLNTLQLLFSQVIMWLTIVSNWHHWMHIKMNKVTVTNEQTLGFTLSAILSFQFHFKPEDSISRWNWDRSKGWSTRTCALMPIHLLASRLHFFCWSYANSAEHTAELSIARCLALIFRGS